MQMGHESSEGCLFSQGVPSAPQPPPSPSPERAVVAPSPSLPGLASEVGASLRRDTGGVDDSEEEAEEDGLGFDRHKYLCPPFQCAAGRERGASERRWHDA